MSALAWSLRSPHASSSALSVGSLFEKSIAPPSRSQNPTGSPPTPLPPAPPPPPVPLAAAHARRTHPCEMRKGPSASPGAQGAGGAAMLAVSTYVERVPLSRDGLIGYRLLGPRPGAVCPVVLVCPTHPSLVRTSLKLKATRTGTSKGYRRQARTRLWLRRRLAERGVRGGAQALTVEVAQVRQATQDRRLVVLARAHRVGLRVVHVAQIQRH